MSESAQADVLSAQTDELVTELSGGSPREEFPPTITKDGAGGKFLPDGRPVRFPGNTFLCHIDPSSDAHAALVKIQNEVRNGPYGSYFSYLPAASLHMTVFPSVCGDPLGYDGIPDGFEPETSLAEMTGAFQSRALQTTGFEKCSVSIAELFGGWSVHVEGTTDDDKASLAAMRAQLQELTALTRPDFDQYQFHITLAYRIRWMPVEIALKHLEHMESVFAEVKDALTDIQLGPVEICSFKDMCHFEKLALLPAN